MATYVIGDVQGCFDELTQLLKEVGFHARRDRLWFVGDLVNRGPKSLEVLRFVRGLNERAVVVLGNHDLHLVTQHEGTERPRPDDTFHEVLAAPEGGELVAWLRTRPLMHVEGRYAMVHAGLLPQWSIARARELAREVEQALAGAGYRDFLRNMYGSQPEQWSEALAGWDRLRVIVNAMTRMRFCTRDGRMEFHAKGAEPPAGFYAWFDTRPPAEEETILCGHWSQLGLKLGKRLAAMDSGCVWGGALSVLRLEDRALYQLPCRAYQAGGGER
jgi:bis(5'-nucleosyl)-tetraphosphatase (symmetrical)